MAFGNGLHLCMDGRLEGRSISEREARSFFRAMVGSIGMTLIAGPFIYKTPNGLQGFVIIAESHVSFETVQGRASVDIFSCKEFDVELAESIIRRYFGLEMVRTALLERKLPPPLSERLTVAAVAREGV